MHIYLKILTRELISDLKGELALLRQQVLEQPTKSGRDNSSHDSDPQNQATSIDLAVIPTPMTLKREDYCDVPYWTK